MRTVKSAFFPWVMTAAFTLSLGFATLAAASIPSLPGTGRTDLERSGLKGPVMSIQERPDSPDSPPSISVYYSNTGMMVDQILYENGKMALRHFYLYGKDGNILRRSDLEYGFNGDPVPTSWSDSEFVYDDRGIEVSATGYGVDGAIRGSRRTVHTYGKDGLKVRTELTFKGDPLSIGVGSAVNRTCLYEYDSKGRPIRELWYVSPWTLHHKSVYSYDSAGRRSSATTYSSEGVILSSEEWRYDGSGRVIEYHSNGALGNIRRVYRYDASGCLTGSDETRDGEKTDSMSVDSKAKVAYYTTYYKGYRNTSVIGGNGLTIRQVKRGDDGSMQKETAYKYDLDEAGNWKKMIRTVVMPQPADGKVKDDVTFRTITYYPDDPVAGKAYFEGCGRVSAKGVGISGVSLGFSKTLASGESSTVADAVGNWFAVGLTPGTVITPFKEGWVFEPASAEMAPEKPLVDFIARPKGTEPSQDKATGTKAPPEAGTPVTLDKVEGLHLVEAAPETVKTDPQPIGEVPAVMPEQPGSGISGDGRLRLRLVPYLGYAFNSRSEDSLNGPTAGLQATVDTGRASILFRGEHDRDISSKSSGWLVESGIGYAILPRKDAKMGVFAGPGYHWGTAQGIHIFAESTYRFGPSIDTSKGNSFEVSLGTRFLNGYDPLGNAYFKVSYSGNKLISLGILAIGIALASVDK